MWIYGISSPLIITFQDQNKVPRGFLLPTVPSVNTRPPSTASSTTVSTSTTTTAPPTTTPTTAFELTPLSSEATTPRLYVSTSNFRPTLPNFGQEAETEQTSPATEAEAKEPAKKPAKDPVNLIQQIPLVLAPRQPKQESSSAADPAPAPSAAPPPAPPSSTVSVSSSSSTSESSFNIHNRLDELASNLDPWAHIQHASQRVGHLYYI